MTPYVDGAFVVTVSACWQDVKHTNIIENARFSTFHPLKLPSRGWTARLQPKPQSASDPAPLSPSHSHATTTPLSRCLRKLFTLYILG